MQVAIYGFQNRVKRVEDAGIAYELNIILDRLALGLPTEPILKNYRRPGKDSPTLEDLEAEEDEALFDHDCDGYRKYLSSLCPKTWREQDHYKVLGLSKLRYRATPGQIKTAYRQKVLRYHPDKGKYKEQLGQQGNDAFSCIQKAYELMCEEDKHRQKVLRYHPDKGKYKEQLGQQGNDAFSCIQKAYELMCEEDKRRAYDSIDPDFDEEIPDASQINAKNFFTKLGPVFERNARYLDAEDKSKGEDRYERREIEKQNKIEREKLRKQDSKRITEELDPRIVLFKKEDKQKKENEKDRKRLEKQKREDERKAAEMEEERKKAEEEEKIKEEKKKADSLSGLTEYDEVVALLTNTAKKDASSKATKKEQTEVIGGKENGWTDEQISLLIKAANVFPAGTSRRWAQVTSYINDHHRDGVPKTEKEVIKQAKAQAAQVTAPVDASKTQGQKETAIDSVGAPVASSNSTTTAAAPTSNGSGIPLDDWSTDEQMKFENALKTIPGSDPKRWEKIAEATGKTKKECIQRYKKIVEMLKARKA
uniref:DnaJ homolog subfamily C member 2 n=1 Tax=Panagrolaimus sp. PS1159 TaxID=55785 RepID=A0AC35FVC0_9BILA